MNMVRRMWLPVEISQFNTSKSILGSGSAQRLALVAGGWDETCRRNGKISKPRKKLENAPRTQLSTVRIVGQVLMGATLSAVIRDDSIPLIGDTTTPVIWIIT
jgi:hypothetical protein